MRHGGVWRVLVRWRAQNALKLLRLKRINSLFIIGFIFSAIAENNPKLHGFVS